MVYYRSFIGSYKLNRKNRIYRKGGMYAFVAVYTVKYQLKVAALLKYCEVVRGIANKSGNCHYHDLQFHLLLR